MFSVLVGSNMISRLISAKTMEMSGSFVEITLRVVNEFCKCTFKFGNN